jgi:hypothetical protein
MRGSWGIYNGTVRNGTFGTELANLLQSNILIRNPSYPDPYGGRPPLDFASTAPSNITIFNDNIRNPFAQTVNLGFSQQLMPSLAVHVDGAYTKTTSSALSANINTPSPATGPRPTPEWGRIVQVSPDGEADYRALFVRVDRPFTRGVQATVSYTLAKSTDTGTTIINFYDPDLNIGPSNTERRHTLVASGSVMLPASVMVGGVWTLRSAMPFSATAGRDLNNDGAVTDLVPGTTRNSGNRNLDLDAVNVWRAANGLNAIAASDINSNRYSAIDLRASRSFRLQGNRKVEIIGQVFNLLGTDNLIASGGLGSYVSNALSDSFGKILTSGNRQQAEVALRYAW